MIEAMTLDTIVWLLGENPSLRFSLIDEDLRVEGQGQGPWISLGKTKDGFLVHVEASILEEARRLLEEVEGLLVPIKEVLAFLIEAREREARRGLFLSWRPTANRELLLSVRGRAPSPIPQEERVLGRTVDGWTVRLTGEDIPDLESLLISLQP